jgi:large subunit ribosomal protein L5
MISIEKVTVNVGVGEAGDKLDKAYALLEKLTGQKPIKTHAKTRNPTFKIRKGLPIGVKTTLRKKTAAEFLKRSLEAVEKRLNKKCFDQEGNFSFGVREYIDIPGAVYDSSIGMYGMDVCVTLYKTGYRVKNRKRTQAKIPQGNRITPKEAIEYITKKFSVVVE